jgi:DNA-binding MurR/RpiR family transcriptional regulator
MRTDVKHKKYKMLYKQVEDMYCNDFMNITQCCKELAMSPSTYHKICKELGKKSVAYDKKKEDAKEEIEQKGANKSNKKSVKKVSAAKKNTSSKKKSKSINTPELSDYDSSTD